VNGVGATARSGSRLFRKLQSGFVQNYALTMGRNRPRRRGLFVYEALRGTTEDGHSQPCHLHPLIGAIVILFFVRKENGTAIRYTATIFAVIDFIVSLYLCSTSIRTVPARISSSSAKRTPGFHPSACSTTSASTASPFCSSC